MRNKVNVFVCIPCLVAMTTVTFKIGKENTSEMAE